MSRTVAREMPLPAIGLWKHALDQRGRGFEKRVDLKKKL